MNKMEADTTSSAPAARKQSAQGALAARRRRREAASTGGTAAASAPSGPASTAQMTTNATRAGRAAGAGVGAPPRPDLIGASSRPSSAVRGGSGGGGGASAGVSAGIGSAVRSTPGGPSSTSSSSSSSSSPMSTVKNLLSSLNADLTSTSDNVNGGEGGTDDGYRIRRVDFDGLAAKTSRPGSSSRGTRTSHSNANANTTGDYVVDDNDSEDSSAWSYCGDKVDGKDADASRGVDGRAGVSEEQGPDASAALPQSTFGTLRPTEPDQLDVTCLTYDSSVVVRIMTDAVGIASVSAVDGVASPVTDVAINDKSSSQQPQSRHCTAAVVVDGTGKGAGEQILTLQRAHDVAPFADANVVRYGDLISLQSPYARNKALGVRKAKRASSDGVNDDDTYGGGGINATGLQIGFYRTVRGQAERWEVLPSRGDGSYVEVGSDVALSSSSAAANGTSAKGGLASRRRAVRSGDPIVLRNVQTGGLLSLGGHDVALASSSSARLAGGRRAIANVTLVTSSYQTTAGGGGSTEGDRTLLDFLRHQDHVRPTPSETFRIIQASAPSCPAWLVDSAQPGAEAQDAVAGGRPFLDGTHLLHPGRDDDLPGGAIQSIFATSGAHPLENQSGDPLAKQPVQVQEQILLDEVLGSLMGLEGRYVKATCSLSGTPPDEQKEDIASEIQSFQFRLASYSVVGGAVDASLRHMLNRILPLSSNFVLVNSFLSARLGRYEFGSVAHALAESMDALIQEHLAFATHMEALYMRPTGLTLSKLLVHVQPSMRTMEALRRVCEVAESLKGGALLNAVSALMDAEFLGDSKAQDVLTYLLDAASVPYLSMLQGWLDNGSLSDPYGEFMIEQLPNEDSQGIVPGGGNTPGDNWFHWFIVRDEHILCSLSLTGREREVAVEKILTAGKYWNAIKFCNGSTTKSATDASDEMKDEEEKISTQIDVSEWKFSISSIELSSYIDRSYRDAAMRLRHLVLGEYQLMKTLRVMKRYFLIDQGEFFVHFLDVAEAELLKEMKEVSRGRIQNWLSMSILPSGGTTRASKCSAETFAMDRYMTSSLQASFATESLVDRLDDLYATGGGIRTQEARTPSRHLYGAMNRGLTGIEALTLDFQYVPFPVSLVLSHRAISSYQLLFRHLFFVKHVERRLVGTWLDHQSMKEFQSLRESLCPTFGLRQRMLHFIQNLVYYMMFEVIEPNWQTMENAISSGKKQSGNRGFGISMATGQERGKDGDQTIDDILAMHNEFLRRTLKDCLLTNGELIRTLTKLMTTCLLFSDQMNLFVETTQINEERDRIAKEERQKRQHNISIVSKRSRLRKTAKDQAAARKARWEAHTELLEGELNTDSYKRMISRFSQVFNNNLTDFMTQLRDSGECANLLSRLDFNGFVSSSLKL